MVMKAELFDGTVLEFPDGTSPDVISRVAREQTALKQPEPTPEVGGIERARQVLQEDIPAFASQLLQGATLGLSDEIVGLVAGEEAQQAERTRLARTREESPITSTVLDVAGGLTTLPAGLIARGIGAGATGLGRIGRAVGIGGGIGAIEGGARAEEGQRGLGALIGGGLGAPLGGLGQGIAEGIARRGFAASQAGTRAQDIAGAELSALERAGAGEVPLTAGQRGQDVLQQAFESSAIKGTRGEGAKETLQAATDIQQSAIQRAAQEIGGHPGIVPETEIVGGVIEKLRSQRATAKAKVGSVFDEARDTGKGLRIRAREINTDLRQGFGKAFADSGLLPGDAPRAASVGKQLRELTKKKSAVDFKKLNSLRSRITKLEGEAFRKGDSADALILGDQRRAYDKFITELQDEAVITGNDEAMALFNKGRELHTEFARRFSDSKEVSKLIINEKLTPEEAVNVLLGAGRVGGKKNSSRIIQEIQTAAGEEAPIVIDKLKQASMQRILSRSESNVIDPQTGLNNISPAKMLREIESLIRGNKSTFEAIYDVTEQSALRKLRDNLRFIVSKKEGAINQSNSFEKLAQNFRGIPVLNRIPFVSSALNEIADSKNTKQAFSAVAEILNEIKPASVGGTLVSTTGTLGGVLPATLINQPQLPRSLNGNK